MAKSKQKASKTPKPRSTKYSKLAAVCSKELAAKKAAMVRAEKALAKAQKTHTELLSEVARLDMLDRSLKALINGTEPPQNVRYVYTYPQWVWYPYNGWYWQGQGNSVTFGNPQTYTYTANLGGNFQGGLTSNAFTTGTTTIPATSGITLTNCNNSGFSTPSASIGSITSSAGSGSLVMNCSDSSLNGLNNSVLTSNAASPTWQTVTTTTTPDGIQPELTIDLSTGASDPEATPVEEAAEVEAATAEVGYGG